MKLEKGKDEERRGGPDEKDIEREYYKRSMEENIMALKIRLEKEKNSKERSIIEGGIKKWEGWIKNLKNKKN